MYPFGESAFDRILESNRIKANQDEQRLKAEPCQQIAEPGDHVLVHPSPVGRGMDGKRLEAKVLAVADTAYKVQYLNDRWRDDKPEDHIEWIAMWCVTDVLGQPRDRREETGGEE